MAGAPDIILTPVRPVLAIFPHAECQAKEQLVQILESLRYDTAGDRVHNLPIQGGSTHLATGTSVTRVLVSRSCHGTQSSAWTLCLEGSE